MAIGMIVSFAFCNTALAAMVATTIIKTPKIAVARRAARIACPSVAFGRMYGR